MHTLYPSILYLLKETIYHEMSHASHYTQVGTAWYTQFVNAELAEIVSHPSGNLNPYGDGHSSNSPIIALGEAWAYHIGQYFTELRYGNTSRCAGEQSICYGNGEIPGLNSHQLLWKILIPIYQQTIL